jgi:hypothetical protein
MHIVSKNGKLALPHEILSVEEPKKSTPLELSKAEILKQFNFDIDAQLFDGEYIPDDHNLTVDNGEDFDLN